MANASSRRRRMSALPFLRNIFFRNSEKVQETETADDSSERQPQDVTENLHHSEKSASTPPPLVIDQEPPSLNTPGTADPEIVEHNFASNLSLEFEVQEKEIITTIGNSGVDRQAPLNSNESIPISFQEGSRVRMNGGKYVGKEGVFMKNTGKRYKIKVDGGPEAALKPSFVELIRSPPPANDPKNTFSDHHLPIETNEVNRISSPLAAELSEPSVGSIVTIVAGTNAGKSGTIVSSTAKMCVVRLAGESDEKVRVRKSSIRWSRENELGNDNASSPVNASSTSHVPRSTRTTGLASQTSQFGSPLNENNSTPRMGLRSSRRVTTHASLGRIFGFDLRQPKNDCLAYKLFDDLAFLVTKHDQPVSTCTDMGDGNIRTLLGIRLSVDEESGPYQKIPDKVKSFYIVPKGDGETAHDRAENELLRIADFSALSARKIASRFELLFSPAFRQNKKPAILDSLDAENIQMIDEPGIDGCGFISEVLLERLLEEMRMGPIVRKRVTAIQVRIVAPRKGFFKGMLMRKRSLTGEVIQLPQSMLKVPPSPLPNPTNKVTLLINQNGVHQSGSSGNVYKVGRLLQGGVKVSLTPKKLKPPAEDMILRFLVSVNVPFGVVEDYQNRARLQAHLKHVYLVGVADPTGALPPGCIFIPGMGQESGQHKELLVARAPCLTRTGGRMLPVVSERPALMSIEDWEWLNGLAFSVVIFAQPREGTKPLPSYISSGDLDGDLYFVCWDGVILSHIQAEPIVDEPAIPEAPTASSDNPTRTGWLAEAHSIISNVQERNDLEKLTGRLYHESIKAADDKDLRRAEAYSEAYKEALDFRKHGRSIHLPARLHESIPRNLRKYLVEVDE